MTAVAVLGNIIIFVHGRTIMDYCQLTESWIQIGNLVSHVVIPLIMIGILVRAGTGPTTVNTKLCALGTTIIIGLVYIILMVAGMASTYGLEPKVLAYYGIGWLLISTAVTLSPDMCRIG